MNQNLSLESDMNVNKYVLSAAALFSGLAASAASAGVQFSSYATTSARA
ncbi:MAG TPA: hypothetical protein VH475_05430 [Tepidisphaeraceae bacterium]|jgi:hypothetical protein